MVFSNGDFLLNNIEYLIKENLREKNESLLL